jgi:eukaryotic-like serine/threonine-protein kinase
MLLFSACGSSGTVNPTATPSAPVSTQTAVVLPTPSPTVTTQPVPPTQTSCPAAGTARAAVTAPLAPGTHANIAYLVKEFSNGSVTSTLKRFDLVTGAKTEILKLPNEDIRAPQISADGQWILFVQSTIQQDKLQLVRMDGQGLQTLYCGSSLSNLIWSADQQSALFGASTPPQGFNGLYLLNLRSGTVQLELNPTRTTLGSIGVYPVTWLDNTHAYVIYTIEPIAPFDRLGILDTSKGPNQPASNIVQIYQDKTGVPFNYPCWDADSSYNGSTLYVAQCSGISAPNCSGSCALGTREGPSTIYTEPGTGGSLQTLLTSQALGIGAVRSVTSTLLLLQVENFSRNHQVDTSQNGLWVVHSDGTGLTRLTTEASKTGTTLCQFSQNPWSNVSRDSSMYAFETSVPNPTAGTTTDTLSYGPLNGGAPQSFASIADGTQLAIIGWTTM